ncbi:alpha/beta fold hydrolase [Massilia sp. ST3]|uniref:alpha/beta fold hydrolase n=1 Tax=Massilia sp. ST3 TaxID=2824903 RepID=UPI001B83DC1D|nr:alpha/beta hydrolase [Massilia sp. ST3]MBQ5946433.1 alpha/beta hydrolase [Massilia sp. ST3]
MKAIKHLALALSFAGAAVGAQAAPAAAVKPTVILVHGAFADASSWNGVASTLRADGYRVIGAANPLRSVQGDADSVSNIVKSVKGPVVLVGHSYGGSVISAAANGNANVKSLVYVAAFAPEAGETALELSGRYPGGTLGQALAEPVPLSGGGKDFTIQQEKFHKQFAADVPKAEAELMAVAQRPIAEAALTEKSGAPAWKKLPSYFIYGSGDKNIPAAALGFMAERAHSRKTVVVPGASHVVMTSHPQAVAALIETAAGAQ